MSELRELYQEVILDHNKSPRNFGAMENPTHQAAGYNPLCGDRYNIYIRLRDDVIEEIRFEGNGCAISKASASLMTEALKGINKAEAEVLFEEVHDMLTGKKDMASVDAEKLNKLVVLSGVSEFPVRVKCATLAWHAMHQALEAMNTSADTKVSTE
jgi:nitrogen fixation NifU-like protein